MFPWNYGFEWNAGHVIFLGAFYTVLVVVATTLVSALLRSRKAVRAGRLESIRWHSDFHELPAHDRVCRHVLTGEFSSRECPNAFDCRKCATHAKLIEAPPAAADVESEIAGMEFPLDRLYHRGHTWVHPEQDGTVTIGLDELGRRLTGAPDEVELPETGSRVRVNGTAFRIRKRGARVRVLSPVDGDIVETGGPNRGWYLRVRPASGDLRHLLRGAEVRPWVMREMERLQLMLSPTLADGGVLVQDLPSSHPDADWDAVCGEMFLEP